MLRQIAVTLLVTISSFGLASTLSGCQEDPSTAIPKLKKELASPDAHTRSKAAHGLAGYGDDAADAVQPLITALGDPNGGVRSAAAYALRKIATKEALAALERAEAEQWKK